MKDEEEKNDEDKIKDEEGLKDKEEMNDEEGLKEILSESKADMSNHLKKKKSKGKGF